MSDQAPNPKIKGEFTLQFHPPGSDECGSHDGACLVGVVTGDIKGHISIDVYDTLLVSATRRTVSASTARVFIHTDDGDLVGIAAGLLDRDTGEFRNTIYWTGGTGAYENANGYARTEGHDTPEGVEHSTFEGYLRTRKQDQPEDATVEAAPA